MKSSKNLIKTSNRTGTVLCFIIKPNNKTLSQTIALGYLGLLGWIQVFLKKALQCHVNIVVAWINHIWQNEDKISNWMAYVAVISWRIAWGPQETDVSDARQLFSGKGITCNLMCTLDSSMWNSLAGACLALQEQRKRSLDIGTIDYDLCMSIYLL